MSEGEGDQSLQEEQETKISSFEEAFTKIKDATGVSNIQVVAIGMVTVTMATMCTQEVVDRFLNQRETRRHLEQLREEHSQQLERLKEDKVHTHGHVVQLLHTMTLLLTTVTVLLGYRGQSLANYNPVVMFV